MCVVLGFKLDVQVCWRVGGTLCRCLVNVGRLWDLVAGR